MTIWKQNNYSQTKIQDGRPLKMVIFGISIIVRHVSGPPPPPAPPWSFWNQLFFVVFLCSFRWNMLPLPEIWTQRPKTSKWPLSKSNTSILMFSCMLNAMGYSKSETAYSEYINNKIQDSRQNTFFCNFCDTYTKFHWLNSECHTASSTDLFRRICYYLTPLCRLLRHQLPTSSQLFINCTSREVDRDWSVVIGRIFSKNSVHHCAPYRPEGIQECSLSILYLIMLILIEFFLTHSNLSPSPAGTWNLWRYSLSTSPARI